jgi:exopolysaccharide biosynthesis polyprenyl glycosylphosphotransferase
LATLPNQAHVAPVKIPLVGARRRLEIARRRPVTPAQMRASGSVWLHAAYMFVDLALIVASGYAVYWIRFFHLSLATLSEVLAGRGPSEHQYVGLIFIYGTLTLLFCRGEDLYWTPRGRTSFEEFLAVAKVVALATVLLMVFVYLSGMKIISRAVVLSSASVNLVTLASWRLWKRRVVDREIADGRRARNVLIVGADKAGQQLYQLLRENPQFGYVVCGFVDQNNVSDPRVLGRVDALEQVARANFVDEIIITALYDRDLVREVALKARDNRWDVKLMPDLYDGFGLSASVDYLGDYPLLELHREPIPQMELFIKRGMDILGSAFALLLLSPVLAILAIAIKLDSPGPVFYRANRVGKKGRKFLCCKFRSMSVNADAIKEVLRAQNERSGAFFKLANDPRITRVGRFLRKYSLDELPQFWNVLVGDMSLVGPRPHPVDDFARYRVDDLRRLDVTPGLTGLWQVTARRDPSFEKNVELDLQYIENWTPWLDMKIILKTFPVVFAGNGQ